MAMTILMLAKEAKRKTFRDDPAVNLGWLRLGSAIENKYLEFWPGYALGSNAGVPLREFVAVRFDQTESGVLRVWRKPNLVLMRTFPEFRPSSLPLQTHIFQRDEVDVSS